MNSQPNNFINYLELVYKCKKNILINIVIVIILSVVFSLIMPKTYMSMAVLMPPHSESDIGILGAFSENLPFSNILMPESDNSLSMMAILKSRTMMEDVINKFDLITLYNAKDIEETLEILDDNIEFEIETEGTLRITSYLATDWFHPDDQEIVIRNLCADIVNYFVERLNILNVKLNIENASFQRMFIENRYKQIISDLHQAENQLKIFQEEHNMVSIEEQTTAAIQVATDLISRISIDKVRLKTLEQTLSPDHPEITHIKRELSGLKMQLDELDAGGEGISLIPKFSDVPNLGLELTRLMRDVEVQNTLYIYLTQQYEDAKIQEARNTPTIQVLDYANIPINKYKPRRSIIVIFSVLMCFILNTMFLVIRENNHQNKI